MYPPLETSISRTMTRRYSMTMTSTIRSVLLAIYKKKKKKNPHTPDFT